MSEPFSAAAVIRGLKDFQQHTVEWVFRHLWQDEGTSRRFLVADEVGLGKTMVARGVTARAIEHLQDKVGRVDIVYVCTNAAIGEQNIRRLNVLPGQAVARATRLTLLAEHVEDLDTRTVNFVSFTPGTTFNLKSSGGRKRERAVIYRLLEDSGMFDTRGLSELLRNDVKRWGRLTNDDSPLSKSIKRRFVRAIKTDRRLRREVADLAEHFRDRRRRIDKDMQRRRMGAIGALRRSLARASLDALEPNLVILDEFQRFKELLDGDSDSAELARDLFNYDGVCLLMLSATPYRMYTLNHETEDDHYADFLRTLAFLYDDETVLNEVTTDLAAYRSALYLVGDGNEQLVLDARDRLQTKLKRVMCRTERVGASRDRDAMTRDVITHAPIEKADLQQAMLAGHVADAVDAPDVVEYWKSTPYVLNYLRHYKLGRLLEAHAEGQSPKLAEALTGHCAHSLDAKHLAHYGPVDPGNGRLRALLDDTVNTGLWRLSWLPPSLPYNTPGGAYADVTAATKALVFSAWSAVPDAVASLTSYEVERRLCAGHATDWTRDQLSKRMKARLTFKVDGDGRCTGMPALALLYPSPTLASDVDPLQLALRELHDGQPPSGRRLLELARERLAARLDHLTRNAPRDGRADERWYWAAAPLLDDTTYPRVREWYDSDEWRAAGGDVDGQGEGTATGDGTLLGELGRGDAFRQHAEQLAAAVAGRLDPPLGRPPDDLAEVVALIAVAAPGPCALRALRRPSPDTPLDSPELLTAATHIAGGFRSLFNHPESLALLSQINEDRLPYWRAVLDYTLDGNIQALLDEQVHILRESLGLVDVDTPTRVASIADAIAHALSVRSTQVRIMQVEQRPHGIALDTFNARCRFALRFGELKDESDNVLARADVLRAAFNSPFPPFVLASTSVGQEGLDFHTWCHAVVHWNLPANPVDLEQREGRVHRFKGHAVRKNVAKAFGLETLRSNWTPDSDPWTCLFDQAVDGRDPSANDLVPYWMYDVDGGAKVERRVALLPFSREGQQLQRLKEGLSLYRLVFGQARQEDLVEHLKEKLNTLSNGTAEKWCLDLRPSTIEPGAMKSLAQAPSSSASNEHRTMDHCRAARNDKQKTLAPGEDVSTMNKGK